MPCILVTCFILRDERDSSSGEAICIWQQACSPAAEHRHADHAATGCDSRHLTGAVLAVGPSSGIGESVVFRVSGIGCLPVTCFILRDERDSSSGEAIMHLAVGVLAPAAQHRHATTLQRSAIAGISLERPTRSGPHLESGNRSCSECLESGVWRVWNRV